MAMVQFGREGLRRRARMLVGAHAVLNGTRRNSSRPSAARLSEESESVVLRREYPRRAMNRSGVARSIACAGIECGATIVGRDNLSCEGCARFQTRSLTKVKDVRRPVLQRKWFLQFMVLGLVFSSTCAVSKELLYSDAQKDKLVHDARLKSEFSISRKALVRHGDAFGTIDRVLLVKDNSRFFYRVYVRDGSDTPQTYWIMLFDARTGKVAGNARVDERTYWRQRDDDSRRATDRRPRE
ncbi:hypothetical protein KTE62_08450 [Burkholderia multivorans]|uniref:hypothetical protein n=1 Tax=Burkholderia multivorans TaxID=87883 RepID=UPI001C220C53|nr:hypothetical protein [Burkholderia multivorans]MBU9441755.1 hypothetical protein [Burkholderia multivorans]